MSETTALRGVQKTTVFWTSHVVYRACGLIFNISVTMVQGIRAFNGVILLFSKQLSRIRIISSETIVFTNLSYNPGWQISTLLSSLAANIYGILAHTSTFTVWYCYWFDVIYSCQVWSVSIRVVAAQTGVSCMSVWNYLCKELKHYP